MVFLIICMSLSAVTFCGVFCSIRWCLICLRLFEKLTLLFLFLLTLLLFNQDCTEISIQIWSWRQSLYANKHFLHIPSPKIPTHKSVLSILIAPKLEPFTFEILENLIKPKDTGDRSEITGSLESEIRKSVAGSV